MRFLKRISNLGRRCRLALATALLLLLLLLLYPFQTIIVPSWPLRVVDNSEQPVAGIKVTEHWQHYLLESEGHEEIKVSNGDGSVAFPERIIRAGLLSRFLATMGKTFRKGQEARTDCYASVVVWGSRDHEIATSVYRPPSPPQAKIVLQRQWTYSRLTTNRYLFSERGIRSGE
jgi:hypothetical protein